jgi:hypothetical protein
MGSLSAGTGLAAARPLRAKAKAENRILAAWSLVWRQWDVRIRGEAHRESFRDAVLKI